MNSRRLLGNPLDLQRKVEEQQRALSMRGIDAPKEVVAAALMKDARRTARAEQSKTRTKTGTVRSFLGSVAPKPLTDRIASRVQASTIRKEAVEERNALQDASIDSFWGAIANGVQGANRDEVIEVLKKLAFFDSIHDFWPERATVKGVTDEDEDAPEELDEGRLTSVHNALVETIRGYLGRKDAAEIGELLQSATGNAVGATSGVEDKVLAYFKKSYAPFNEEEGHITLSEILSNWKLENKTWAAYSAAVGSLPTAIEIIFSGRSIKSLTDSERNTIAFFLLAYMNPSVQPGAGAIEYFTFDMAPRDIGKIFARIGQVKNAIYPQNIADSATTSFSALMGRSQFFRADGSLPQVPAQVPPNTHVIRSNAFTWNKYKLQYVDQGFSPANKFGFKIEVWNASATGKLGEIPFGERNEQGPSVNYLMDIISDLRNAKTDADAAKILSDTQPKIGTVAKLNLLKVPDISLLFDIKRKGDWEQMLLNDVTAVSGDRFAAALRRLLRKRGMFHSVRGIKTWKGTEGLSPEALEARSRNFRIQQVLSKLAIVNGVLTNTNGVREALTTMKAEADFGATNGYVFSPPIPIPTPLTLEYVAANYTAVASTFATLVLRYRMLDLSAHIGSLMAKLASFNSPEDITRSLCAVSPANCPAPPPGPPTIDTIYKSLDTLEGVIKKIDELEALTISFSASGGAVEPISVELFERPSGKLKKGATSLKFNFSAGPFLHPDSGLSAIVARLLVLSKARRPDAVAPQINKLLVEYFRARDMIKEMMFNAGMKSTLEEITDIQSGLTPTQVISPGVGGLLAAISRTVGAVPLAGGGEQDGGGGIQSGGADGSPLQFRDLNDLFLELCLDVSSGASMTLDDIEARWVTGIDELRSSAVEDYGVPFEETRTTDLISFILSFRTGGNTLFPVEMTRRDAVRFEDIRGVILTKIPVETAIGEALVRIGEVMIAKGDKYASRAGWTDFERTLAAAIRGPIAPAVLALLGGGLEGGDDSSSNAGGTRTGSSRRGLYARLQQRAGEGSPPIV